MSDPGAFGQGQPPDQPFNYQDPAAGWPGYQQPGQAVPGQQFQPIQPAQPTFQPQPTNDAFMSGEQVMVSIGDISVTSTTVYTPSGARPLSEVTWTFTDMSITSQGIPTWAIVCAVVFFLLCFLGLLFLLAKEDKTQGSVQVTVHGPGFLHTSTIPVASRAQVADINARVNYVRTLTASYPQPGLTGQPSGGPQGITGQPWQQDQPGQAGQPWQQGQPGQAGQPWLQSPSDPGQAGQQDRQPGQSW
jgi:hypothetical protein